MKKQSYRAQEFDLGLESAPGAARGNDLMVVARTGAELSAAQVEFNKLMKRLENTRTKHQREQNRLDGLAATCVRELMPLVDQIHRLNFQMVVHGVEAMQAFKLTARRRDYLGDLLSGKASDLVAESSGLTEDEVERMRTVVTELGTSSSEEEMKQREVSEFDYLRGMMEAAARQAGVELDLSDLDLHGDPAEFEKKLRERLEAVASEAENFPSAARARARKPTKAQLEREKKEQEAEELKRRDLKSLYKQLAKVLHPDLETDPVRKLQKEEWMKRLTTAHSSGDLRELLSIEMEWLGVEASNLANATDQKLKVYCTVLKEQIAEIKAQMHFLINQPQYAVLDRFRDPIFGRMSDPVHIKASLNEEILRHEGMLEVLRKGGTACGKMLNRWADDHARAAREMACPF